LSAAITKNLVICRYNVTALENTFQNDVCESGQGCESSAGLVCAAQFSLHCWRPNLCTSWLCRYSREDGVIQEGFWRAEASGYRQPPILIGILI